MNIKITGTGSYIPKIVQNNIKFLDRTFYDTNGDKIETKNEEIIEKFQSVLDSEPFIKTYEITKLLYNRS